MTKATDLRQAINRFDPENELRTPEDLAAFYIPHPESMGRYDEAGPLLRQALEGLGRMLGPDHPTTQTVAASLERLRAAHLEAQRPT